MQCSSSSLRLSVHFDFGHQLQRILIVDLLQHGVRQIDTRLVDLGLVDPAANYQGVMTQNYMTRITDITDGTSRTILITEDSGRPKGIVAIDVERLP